MPRLLIVLRSGEADRGNQAAGQVDRVGGNRTFTVKLSRPDAPDVPVAYWCSWQMSTARAVSIRDRLREQGYTAAETSLKRRQDTVDPNGRIVVFDGDEWTPDEALQALGLRRPDSMLGGG